MRGMGGVEALLCNVYQAMDDSNVCGIPFGGSCYPLWPLAAMQEADNNVCVVLPKKKQYGIHLLLISRIHKKFNRMLEGSVGGNNDTCNIKGDWE